MATTGGWIFEENVVRFLRHLSWYVGYDYDAADEDALTGALDDTDDESEAGWFRYPIEGTPPLVVDLAQGAGSGVVSIRVDGEMDAVLLTRVETMLHLLSAD